MAKHILHTGDDDLDFVLIGLRCAEDQYTVKTIVEDKLRIPLYLSDYVQLNLKEGRIFNFSLFRYFDERFLVDYYFIPNLSNLESPDNRATGFNDLFSEIDVDERTRLIRELPLTDYFIILKGEEVHQIKHKVLDLLKDIASVIQVQLIEAAELPSRRNLIF